MKDKALVRIAMICSIIGVGMLFFVSSFMEIPERNITNLSSADISKTIKLNGIVQKVVENEKTAKITVEQPTYIDAVVFKENSGSIGFKKGQDVELIGEYREVKGRKELVIDEIKMKSQKNNNNSSN